LAMFTRASLTCSQCGKSFPLNLNVKPQAIRCPFCQKEMASDMIEDVYTAAGYVSDINYRFRKYLNERDEPEFRLSVWEEEIHYPYEDTE
jgi:transcription elongation factor Elf1